MFMKTIDNFKMQVVRKTKSTAFEGIYDKTYDCVAPCSMYSVLLASKDIPDPFVGLNESAVAELSRNDCVFTSLFSVSAEQLAKKNKTLVFYGLDTVCDVYLNGVKILYAENMHRTFSVDCGADLKVGDNELKLYFYSPLTFTESAGEKHPLPYWNELNDGVGHLRKAFYMFSWDWGPRVPDMGIWRKIELKATDYAEIDDVVVAQNHSNGEVSLDVTVKVSRKGDYECRMFFDGESYRLDVENDKTVTESERERSYTIKNVKVKNPELWWPNGYGKQHLYELKAELYFNNDKVAECAKRIGLRTLEVSTKLDDYGRELCFIVNGKMLFLMGANYIPQDNVLSRVNRETTESLIKKCVGMNFNALRVWGGGYYPDDDFYELCDENGLIVWQDFMVACVCVRASESFKANFLAEISDNVKRIRHHACIGLFGGNNEVEDMVSEIDDALVRTDYVELYENAVPELLKKIAPEIRYLPSSPTSGTPFKGANAEDCLDMHYWGVWHGYKPFTAFRDIKCRFMSEFGFIAFPDIKTSRFFASDEQLNPFSEVMESHQKDYKGGNRKILDYLSDNYLLPSDFEGLTYISQILQADAIRYGVEHFRRIRHICKGTFYWQLNDCWPTASWSSVDYFGRKKALAYESKRFYAPIMLSLRESKTSVDINVSNESLKDFNGRIVYELETEDFNVLKEGELSVCVSALTATDVLHLDIEDYMNKYRRNGLLVVKLFDREGNELMKRTLPFSKPKYFAFADPKLSFTVKKAGRTATVTVFAKCYAKSVAVSFKTHDFDLSDNFFDITDGNGYSITFETDLTEAELLSDVVLKTVYDCKMK